MYQPFCVHELAHNTLLFLFVFVFYEHVLPQHRGCHILPCMSRNTGQINPAGLQSLKYMYYIHVIMMIKWFWLWLSLWLCWIYYWEVKDIFPLSVISQFWDGTRGWNHPPRKIRTCWSCIFNTMVADVLVTQRVMGLTKLSLDILL